jgi:hypothetical protein
MKQCWPDGDLRAFLDGELPAESQHQIAAHLELCAACEARRRELAERALRVSKALGALPEAAPAAAVPIRRHRRQWAVAALSLAAALAMAFVLLPRPAVVQPPPPAPPAARAAAAPVALPPRPAARRHPAARRPALREDFLRLDDEPIETGVLVRVSAENGDVLADLIVGPDGRAHAIRVVSSQ